MGEEVARPGVGPYGGPRQKTRAGAAGGVGGPDGQGVPTQAVLGPLQDFVVRLFKHVAPELKDQAIILDKTHRAGHPARSLGQAQGILTCLHHYNQRETILVAAHNQNVIEFEGHRIGLFQELLILILQRRRTLRQITNFLHERDIRYKWGHPFRLQFVWLNEKLSIRTMEEAQALERMPPGLRDWPRQLPSQERPSQGDRGRLKHRHRRNKSHKPMMAESQKERAALIWSLHSQDSVSEAGSEH
ncbi:hypothetical protein NDU88_004712 [Pleurodeles waltl]|uniref:Uncharacterized protein n=1 Tax=Pleurodeles waltl TaxID=8319 RepID=A0AAV7LQ47_PLEWA|nr:hypothetical protein NDU88_004712 [Pleurodeles waltl]